jgi:lysophospholipid acyltransferase (LPLAT)-like uncharacterized protein
MCLRERLPRQAPLTLFAQQPLPSTSEIEENMKIRHPLMIKAIGFTGAGLFRLWMASVRRQFRALGPEVRPRSQGLRQRYIYATWHEHLLLPLHFCAGAKVYMLASQHPDGRIFSEVCRYLRISRVHGSATRGGVQAMKRLLRAAASAHLALTPDGPRGPRRQLKPGIVFLAARAALPIVPTGFGFQRAWRLGSWDRLAVPYPFSRVACVTGSPIAVPGSLTKAQLQHYCHRVESALDCVTQIAENWAETGSLDSTPLERWRADQGGTAPIPVEQQTSRTAG